MRGRVGFAIAESRSRWYGQTRTPKDTPRRMTFLIGDEHRHAPPETSDREDPASVRKRVCAPSVLPPACGRSRYAPYRGRGERARNPQRTPATAEYVLDLLAGRGSHERRTDGSRTASAVVTELLAAGARVPASLVAEWLQTGAFWAKTYARRVVAGRWIRARGGPGAGIRAYVAAIEWLAAAAIARWGRLSARSVAWWRRRIAEGADGMVVIRAGVWALTDWRKWARLRKLRDSGGGPVDWAMALRSAARMRELEGGRRRK